MTIDKALEGISAGENKEEKKTSEQATNPDSITEIMKQYPVELSELVQVEEDKFQGSSIQPFCRYLRFDKNLALVLNPIPLEEVISYLSLQDNDMGYLLNNTNLRKLFPDPFKVNDLTHYEDIPSFLNIKTALRYAHLFRAGETSNKLFVIPDLSFMSLFIKNGETLRGYAKTFELPTRNFFILISRMGQKDVAYKAIEPFSTESIKRFHVATGVDEVADMVCETEDLISNLKAWNKHVDAVEGAKQSLFERLKQYNPGLVYE